MQSYRFEALGGECELYAFAPREPLERTAAWVHGLHRRFTRFEPTSELSRLNARAGAWVAVSPDLREVLAAALDAYADSAGLVNAGVLGARGPLPPLPSLLDLRGSRARLAPGAAIDLGGIAKGWIADRAVERLGPNSVANCCGDLRATGGGPDGEGWPIGFGGTTVLVSDGAAATSGRERRGTTHLIDPRTGAAAITDLAEVSVLTATALEAEVAAKTALLLGSIAAPGYLEVRARAWWLA